MKWSGYCQFLWFVSIYAMIFFVFLWVSLQTQPQYIPFTLNNYQQTVDSCLLVAGVYLLLFLITSWFRARESSRPFQNLPIESTSDDGALTYEYQQKVAPTTERMSLINS